MSSVVPISDSPKRTQRNLVLGVLGVALVLRVLAAFIVTRYAARKGTLCVFPDTLIYWELARSILAGDPYQVFQGDAPHYALRTPGYPLFLALCRWLFGPSLLAVRLVQAVLGTVTVGLVARLVRAVWPHFQQPGWVSLAWVAAAFASLDPYLVGMTELVLSEALFLPFMMGGLWGLAQLWQTEGHTSVKHRSIAAALIGAAMGVAVLARPSWLLFVPAVLVAWIVAPGRGRRNEAMVGSLIVVVAMAALMAPWWVRVYRIHERFVPTALWVGASLYDGVGPQANGESDMAFVEAPDVRSLSELDQEATFRARSWQAIQANPVRILRLALVKVGRFWSPWPNASMLRSPWVNLASAAVTVPVYGLLMLGVWNRRKDFRALVLLLGPLIYFCALHAVFVSSIRYRIPGMVPAYGLVALGGVRLGDLAGSLFRPTTRKGS